MLGTQEANELGNRLHATLLEWLVRTNDELAALTVDGYIVIGMEKDEQGDLHFQKVIIDVPAMSFSLLQSNDTLKSRLIDIVIQICFGHITYANGSLRSIDWSDIQLRVKLVHLEENWQDKVKRLILNIKNPNQGLVTELMASRDNKQIYTYNEMKFGSKSEIRIAQELETRKILFFPLPLAVRNDSEHTYLNHREPDFLICNQGKWGILEVSYHLPERYEKDSEKDAWFKKEGIFVHHFTAEKCYNESKQVVYDFLQMLARS